MEEVVQISHLPVTVQSAGLCGLIYVRSWPETASCSYSSAQIGARLVERGPRYWMTHLENSPVRVAGEVDGLWGFGLITSEPEGLELSYLFVEPEAFGTGLAAAIYDELLEDVQGPLCAWVLSGNVRSQRFFIKRGWVFDDRTNQPLWADGHEYIKLWLHDRPLTIPS